MVTEDKRLFGERMRQARDLAGLTNREVAEQLAKSVPHTPPWYSEIDTLRRNLRRWLRGHNKPSADVVLDYARIVGVSPQFFHSGEATEQDVLAPLMRVIESIVDKRMERQTSELREIVTALPEDVHPLDAVGQACTYAHGRALVAQAEARSGNIEEAASQLDYAIARLSEAITKAAA